MPSGKKHKDFKTSSSGAAEVVLGGGTYMKKETPGNVLGEFIYFFRVILGKNIFTYKSNYFS